MNNPASEKQVAFIEKLLGQIRAAGKELDLRTDEMSKGEASTAITTLLAIVQDLPKPAPPVAEAGGIEAGHYAIEVGGVVHFYRIDKPADGKWAGWTFVKRQYGDNYERLRGGDAKAVLEQIGTDPVAAMSRYGQEVGACGRCNRSLTDEESRKLGIGPECRKILALV